MEVTMKYSRYKKHYCDCKIKAGSYDKINKTIVVLIEDDRLKPSGVRGESFHTYKLYFLDRNKQKKYCVYRAICLENAIKQLLKDCKKEGWTPILNPEYPNKD